MILHYNILYKIPKRILFKVWIKFLYLSLKYIIKYINNYKCKYFFQVKHGCMVDVWSRSLTYMIDELCKGGGTDKLWNDFCFCLPIPPLCRNTSNIFNAIGDACVNISNIIKTKKWFRFGSNERPTSFTHKFDTKILLWCFCSYEQIISIWKKNTQCAVHIIYSARYHHVLKATVKVS